MLNEIDRVYCVNCECLLFIEYFDSKINDLNHYVFSENIYYNTGFFCTYCIMPCNTCNVYVEYDDIIDGCCESCYKKNMIKNTYNDIIKKLPVELVDCIMKYL